MSETKLWWQSSSVIGSIVVLLSLIASAFNYDINTQMQGDMVNTALAISGAIGSAVAIYGRIKATKVITGKSVVAPEHIAISDVPIEAPAMPTASFGSTTEPIIPSVLQPVLDQANSAFNAVVADNIQALSAQTK